MEDSEVTVIAPAEPDWNAIRDRYLDGEELAGIATDYGITAGAIATRAWRYRWKAQLAKRLEENRDEVEREVRGNMLVSVWKESRSYALADPAPTAAERLTFAKARECCYNLASRLFGWEQDVVANAKAARVLDIAP